MKDKILSISIVCILYFTIVSGIISCDSIKNKEGFFKSDFTTSEARTWIGPEYWANPLQDWEVVSGRLECLVSKPNRNVHLLTRKLDTVKGGLTVQVNFKLLSPDELASNKNWVGFSIGSKGQFNDYRDNAIFGKGLNIGVTTNGEVFIDEMPESNTVNDAIIRQLREGVDLKVVLHPKGDKYQLEVVLLNAKTKEKISEKKASITANKLVGDLVLVSDYKTKKNSKYFTEKSVSFKDWEVSGTKLEICDENKFGPILFSQFTLSRGGLKLTAQMAPVILNSEKVEFQIKENSTWKTIQEIKIDKDARTATFKFDRWDISKDIPYRLSYKMDKGLDKKEAFYWEGTIRKDPTDQEEIVIAGFTGNSDLGFPNSDITKQVKFQNPDVLFFSGDQIYETVGGYGTQRFPTNVAMLDYLRKWYVYGWAYRDLMKDRPTVSITDDHDVYHGNIWGEGGVASPTKNRGGSVGQDAGGYMMPPEWVKMVERTQTSHLPDPYDAAPVAQGIGTYYTDMVYGGISFAILEDRKFKSAPKKHLPKAQIKNGWSLNKDFDMAKNGDVVGAKLLGDRQLKFLDAWVSDWGYQSQMKMLLSQTIFANVATLPSKELSGSVISKLKIMREGEYPPNDMPVADLDSNGWPQKGRNKAVEIIRKGFVFHLAGDQHLGSTVQYGVDEWNDSGYALCVPSISNYWPRRWFPAMEGKNRNPAKPKYTGEYKDGFGNKMTVHAASNPTFTGKTPSRLYDRATGYGIVRLNKKKRVITLECWPRMAQPKLGDTEQYEGWPITIRQEDNYGRKAKAFLPEVVISGLKNPVVQVINEKNAEIVYSMRINENIFKAKIFDTKVSYTVRVGEPDTNNWQQKNGIRSYESKKISFSF